MYTFLFPLGKLGIPFQVSQKVTKESLTLDFVFLFLLLNFSYLVLFLFFLREELEEPLTSI